MSDIEDRPTLGERYSSATNSSHLKLTKLDEGRCDLDIVVAAGWSGHDNSLGMLLYRLASEFDSVRSSQKLAVRQADMRATALNTLRRKLAEPGLDDARRLELATEYQRHEREGASEWVTNRLLILSQLKSLTSTKDAVGQWAVAEAEKAGFMPLGPIPKALAEVKGWRTAHAARAQLIATLAGRTLDAWLDPLCPKCEGRTFNGGYGSPRIGCKSCRETGKRTAALSKVATEQSFCMRLAAQMSVKASGAEEEMKRRLKG